MEIARPVNVASPQRQGPCKQPQPFDLSAAQFRQTLSGPQTTTNRRDSAGEGGYPGRPQKVGVVYVPRLASGFYAAVGVSGAERFRPNASGTIGKTCSGSGRAGAPNFTEGRQLFLRVPSSSQPLPRPYIIYIIGSPTRLVQSASTASIRSPAPPGSPNYISASPCRPPPPQCLRACPLLPFLSTRHLASGTG